MNISKEKLGPIKEAIFNGQKITAIKLYREATRAGLADAKNEVEKIESELRGTSPNEFKLNAAPARKGCLSVVVLVCSLTAVAVLLCVSR